MGAWKAGWPDGKLDHSSHKQSVEQIPQHWIPGLEAVSARGPWPGHPQTCIPVSALPPTDWARISGLPKPSGDFFIYI